ncbi:MAG: DUF3386 family protein [Pirellulales bacterium]|nr:DUF3386 family protein [Pirellulales bacterium]
MRSLVNGRLTVLALGLIATLVAGAAPAAAHFVWITTLPAEGDALAAHVWFSETAEPGSARLISKIAHTEAWARTPASPQAEKLSLKPITDDVGGALVGLVGDKPPLAVEAVCRYGVFSRGDRALLLNYYARHLEVRTAAELAALARAEKLDLDIVPQFNGDQATLSVLWKGKPAVGAEVVVHLPGGGEQELMTDDKGLVNFDATRAGSYALRAKFVEPNSAGEHDGNAYAEAWHVTTLTLVFPTSAAADSVATPTAEPGEAAAAADKSPDSANALLARAREARAVWSDFPGFESDVTLNIDGTLAQGRVEVSADGDVKLSGVDSADAGWVRQQLALLIRHRMPAPFGDQQVVFGDDTQDHPLGRLVKFVGDSAHSAYRIKDDVIHEVNRDQGAMRFTISTLEVARNAEGKYMPADYSASYWERESGRLKSNETYHEEWVRVGEFDLPKRHVVVLTGNDTRRVMEIDFAGHRLKVDDKTAAAGK